LATTTATAASNPAKPGDAATEQPARMLALDVLRGFTMFWIIGSDSVHEAFKKIGETGVPGFFANQFKHRSWEGFVFYDLIFPMFIFIIGISLVFSLQKIVQTHGKSEAYRRVFKRFVLMFLLGVFYDEFMFKLFNYTDGEKHIGVKYWDWDENMLCGVLQRLAIAYAVTSVLFLNFSKKGLIAIFVAITVLYSGALIFIKAPDQEAHSWERDKNIIHYIDHQIPPYRGSDPESIATTPPAITTCLIGVFTALFLQDKRRNLTQKVQLLIAIGAAMTIFGYAWGYLPGGFHYPIIKRLWTSTYVLVAGGFSLMMLGAFIYIIDVLQVKWWTPMFMWIGMNPLLIYMSTNILDYPALARRFVGGPIEEAAGRFGPMLVAIVALSISVLIVRYFYQKKIFLRL
jgi:predicted acyltransferase